MHTLTYTQNEMKFKKCLNLRCKLDLRMRFSIKVFCGATRPLRAAGISQPGKNTIRPISKD